MLAAPVDWLAVQATHCAVHACQHAHMPGFFACIPQDDAERQELRVEMALAALSAHRQQNQRTTAAADAVAGIDAFEMTLKRLGVSSSTGSAGKLSPHCPTLDDTHHLRIF